MRRCFVLSKEFLEQFTADAHITNVIMGTGVLARDMQRKLRLLNLKAPILIGAKDDPENGVLGYENLETLGNPESCRFICCMDMDEFALIAPVHSAVRKLLGSILVNNPRFIRFSTAPVLGERVPDLRVDAHVHSCRLSDGRFYTIHGDPGNSTAFNIHILGACTVSEMNNFAERSIPYLLWKELNMSGFNGTVYSWGQTEQTGGDNLVILLRDMRFYKPNLVILLGRWGELDPVKSMLKNVLAVSTYHQLHYSVKLMQMRYNGEINNGIDHNIELAYIGMVQNKIFEALSKHMEFAFWHIIPPTSLLMAEEQSRTLTGLNAGYLSRQRKAKDGIVAMIGSPNVRDFTGIFDGEQDIFGLFVDATHFTDRGNGVIAHRMAQDILAEYTPIKQQI
ncbi:MAG: hypothetical protein LBS19_13790 [Clostridiales bacterium]|jgi:hypothetical protein|nr:hypothetical protein [Clostridiales bacterium]